MKTAIALGIFFSVCCIQECSAFCGDKKMERDLVCATERAAEWIRANVYDNTSHTEGHILATALHSLRLVGKSVNKISGKRSTALLKSELDNTGLENIPTGRIALYVYGVYAACKNPRMFYNYNLVKRLKTGIVKFPKPGFDNYFQYSTVVLAMCISGYNSPRLTKPLSKKMRSWAKRGEAKGQYCLDTVAMATIALSCMYDGSNGFKDRIFKSVKKGTKLLLKRQLDDGSFGNSTTTALVAQALLSAKGIGGPYKKWQCTKTMRYLLQQQQNDGSYGDLMSTVQVMPVLIGAAPADLKKLKCHKEINRKTSKWRWTKAMQHLFQLKNDGLFPDDLMTTNRVMPGLIGSKCHKKISTTISPPVSNISVCVRLEFNTTLTDHSVLSSPREINMTVPSNTNTHEILRLAAERDQRYNFTTSKTKYGHMITSIYGVKENPNLNKYWMIFSEPDKMAPSGIDNHRPKHNSCVIFKYMKIGGC